MRHVKDPYAKHGNLNVTEKILRAKKIALLYFPFYSYCLHFLRIEPDPNGEYQTLATNGEWIRYNEAYLASLTVAQVLFCLMHEVQHVVLEHFGRMGQRQQKEWNEATDFANNGILIKQNKRVKEKAHQIVPPDNIFYNPEFDGMSAEAIYDILPKTPEEKKKGKLLDDHGAQSPLKKNKKSQRDWRSRAFSAYHHAQGRGVPPAGLDEFVKELTQPTVSWRAILHRFVNQFSRDNYTWLRPNMKMLYTGFYLPSCHNKSMGDVAVILDNSASVSDQELAQFLTEIGAIRRSHSMTLHIIVADATVRRHIVVRPQAPFDPKSVSIQGRGGTDFRPAFAFLAKKNIRPKFALYLTDGGGVFPEVPPRYPVMWALNTNCKPPWGKYLKV